MRIEQLEQVAKSILGAKCPEDVFGSISADDVGPVYKKLVQLVHPDLYQSDVRAKALADEAFRRLTVWREQADAKFKSGSYGDRRAPEPAAPREQPVIVKVKGAEYHVGERFSTGDVADLRLCTRPAKDGAGDSVIFKIAQRPSENDLMRNEALMVSKVYKPEAGLETFKRYLPKLVDSFDLKGAKSTRRVNVLKMYAEHMTLAHVLAERDNGFDFRDVAWIWKRILEVLGYVHEKQGVVHGAVLPPHVMIHPVSHGVKLIDWCYAVDVGKPITAISAAHRTWYPQEVLAKRPATPATDVYMAARVVKLLLGHTPRANTPSRFSGLMNACLIEAPHRRPASAWEALDSLNELLDRVVGKNTYREFKLKE